MPRFGSERGPALHQHIKPGGQSEIVWWEVSKDDVNEAEEDRPRKRDFVRYRVTVTCLKDGELPDRGDGADDEGKDEQPETTEEPDSEERSVAGIKKLGGKVETVRDRFDADATARSIWLGDDFEPDWLVVDFTDRPVTDAGLEHLIGLAKLRILVLANTQVTDAGLVHLKRLTNLKSLSLRGTQVADDSVRHLKGLTQLQYLSLSEAQVRDAGLAHLQGMTNLRILYLSDTQVTDAGFVHLKGLTNLEQLHLDGTQVTGSGLKHVSGMASLRCIALDGTQVTDAGLAHLKGLTNLRTLWFRNTQVTEAGVNDLKKSLQECDIYH
jgi:hypothetical protein